MSNLIGVCKKEIKKTLPLYSNMENIVFQEFIIPEGTSVQFYLNENPEKPYYFLFKWKKIEISKKKLEENFEIIYEKGCYNACIQKGVPCEKLISSNTGKTSRDKKEPGAWCRIHWEVGRGQCSGYQPSEGG